MLLKRIGNFRFFFKDSNKKSWSKMFKEILHFWYVKKELPLDYFRRFLYRKEVENYIDYLGYKQYKRIVFSEKLVSREINSILDNKLSMDYYFSSMNLPMPNLTSHNLKNHYCFNSEVRVIKTRKGLIDFFNLVFENNLEKKLFLKPLDSVGGKGVLLLNKQTLEAQVDKYLTDLLNNSFLHQEVIKQHEDINKVYSKSINTLRIETYINNEYEIKILSVIMRFGVGNSIVDNASAGGFYISVNLDTGKLQGIGRQDLVAGGQVYSSHPDTNTKLEGVRIPFFKEACELAKKAAQYLPNRIIGWDIAITPNGPIIIEGNQTPGMDMTDIAYGGYCKHPMVKEMLSIVNS